VPMNMIRKTILLQHPSGSQALQDLSFPPAKWAPSPPVPKDRRQMHPGICAQSQRTGHNRMNVS